MEALIYLSIAFAVCVALYGAWRVVRRDGKPTDLRAFGRAVDDEVHAVGREAEDKLRDRLRTGGGHGDDKGG